MQPTQDGGASRRYDWVMMGLVAVGTVATVAGAVAGIIAIL